MPFETWRVFQRIKEALHRIFRIGKNQKSVLKYFNHSEFDSPDAPGSGKNMNHETLQKLDNARANAGIPFIISSGWRTEKHNEKVGGADNSAHLRGYAADIEATDSRSRYLILEALRNEGFNRFGIGKNFIHVDDDPDLYPNVIWHYY